jgi:hypothetical protein
MWGYQVSAIVVCVVLNMLDVIDVLVMSLTTPGVSEEWKLSGSALGLLFSAGLIGWRWVRSLLRRVPLHTADARWY